MKKIIVGIVVVGLLTVNIANIIYMNNLDQNVSFNDIQVSGSTFLPNYISSAVSNTNGDGFYASQKTNKGRFDITLYDKSFKPVSTLDTGLVNPLILSKAGNTILVCSGDNNFPFPNMYSNLILYNLDTSEKISIDVYSMFKERMEEQYQRMFDENQFWQEFSVTGCGAASIGDKYFVALVLSGSIAPSQIEVFQMTQNGEISTIFSSAHNRFSQGFNIDFLKEDDQVLLGIGDEDNYFNLYRIDGNQVVNQWNATVVFVDHFRTNYQSTFYIEENISLTISSNLRRRATSLYNLSVSDSWLYPLPQNFKSITYFVHGLHIWGSKSLLFAWDPLSILFQQQTGTFEVTVGIYSDKKNRIASSFNITFSDPQNFGENETIIMEPRFFIEDGRVAHIFALPKNRDNLMYVWKITLSDKVMDYWNLQGKSWFPWAFYGVQLAVIGILLSIEPIQKWLRKRNPRISDYPEQ